MGKVEGTEGYDPGSTWERTSASVLLEVDEIVAMFATKHRIYVHDGPLLHYMRGGLTFWCCMSGRAPRYGRVAPLN